jgi:hypothetical protein
MELETKETKTPKFKWTEDKETYLAENYDKDNSGASVKALAAHFGVSERSVISKLVNLEKYQAPEKKKSEAVKDEGPTKKDIISALKKSGINTEGAEGATKAFLEHVAEVLNIAVIES